jgi:tetratricopeptide (TPR) repeat protein
LNALGRGAEAVDVARKATELDPVNTNAWTSLGRSLNGIGDLAAARVALERALAISPNSSYGNYQLGCNYLYQGSWEQGLDVFEKMGNVGYKYAGIAMAQHSLGRRAESDAALAKLIKEFPGAAYQTAQAYAWRGEKDKAFEWLDIALDRNDGGVTFVKSDPIMAKYRGDPRFTAFLRKMGLPE